MSNASLPHAAVNRSTVARAVVAARTACASYPHWLNAVNRAALELEAVRWYFNGDVLKMESSTSAGTWYTVDSYGCTCRAGSAGKPCKHRAARRLLRKAIELAPFAA